MVAPLPVADTNACALTSSGSVAAHALVVAAVPVAVVATHKYSVIRPMAKLHGRYPKYTAATQTLRLTRLVGLKYLVASIQGAPLLPEVQLGWSRAADEANTIIQAVNV